MAVFAVGLVALVLGLIGIIGWSQDFLTILRGAVPLMLILGGALAAYLGYEEIKDKGTSDMDPDKNEDDLKKEVETLKEELKELKKEETSAGEE